MCETQIISKRISSLGRRSFSRRLRMASPAFVEKRGEMNSLLNDVDSLCQLLHEVFPTITAEDYMLFAAKLHILITTLKALLQERQAYSFAFDYKERLRQQIEDLEELDHDLKAFKVDAPQNEGLKQAMMAIGQLDFTRIVAHK